MLGTTASAERCLGEEWLTGSQAAARIGCSSVWVAELAKIGRLPCLTTPLGRLYPAADVAEFAAARRATGGGRHRGRAVPGHQPLTAA
jgi:hypothetical protein